MHFPIIAIESIDTKKKDFITDLPYDDIVLQSHTEYYGEMYSKEERKNVIKSDWLKDFLDGFAILNRKKETITFLDMDTIRMNFDRYLLKLAEDLHGQAERGELTGFALRCAAEEYKGHSKLFYFSGIGRTSFDFIEDSVYYAGKTYRIGNIFDAHY